MQNSSYLYEIASEYQRKENYKKALEWYKKSADLGSVGACQALAQAYNGRYFDGSYINDRWHRDVGITLNRKEAAKWYTKAANLGDVNACLKLADMYRGAAIDSLEPNKVETIKWYTKAADLGDISAYNKVGDLYWYGEDRLNIAKNEAEALRWYMKASIKNNDGRAESHIADKYYDSRDFAKALQWAVRGRDKGDSSAAYTVERIKRETYMALEKNRQKKEEENMVRFLNQNQI